MNSETSLHQISNFPSSNTPQAALNGSVHYQNGTVNSADSTPLSRDMLLLQILKDAENDLVVSRPGSLYHQPPKAAERGAAQRLAKRLFYLEGFTATDVLRHLIKRDEFSQLVGEEYACHFNFAGMTLDQAVREFLTRVVLFGEPHDQERVLQFFSRRYHQCNPTAYPTEEACHYLTCAVLVLSSELHEQTLPRQLSMEDFMNHVASIHGYGAMFSPEELADLYQAIQKRPILWNGNNGIGNMATPPSSTSSTSSSSSASPSSGCFNTLISLDTQLQMQEEREFLRGFLIRKCVTDNSGKKVRKTRRGWKTFYARLKGLYLYLYRTEDYHEFEQAFSQLGSAPLDQGDTGSVQRTLPEAEQCLALHHSLAWIDNSYNKKANAFCLRLHSGAHFLLRTYANVEMREWLRHVNYVAALLSPAVLLDEVTSSKENLMPHYSLSCTEAETVYQQIEQHVTQYALYAKELAAVEGNLETASVSGKSKPKKQLQQRQNFLKSEMERVKSYMETLNRLLGRWEPIGMPPTFPVPQAVPLEYSNNGYVYYPQNGHHPLPRNQPGESWRLALKEEGSAEHEDAHLSQ